jgi:hypothetical protein
MNRMSKAVAASWVGSSPEIMYRKFAAWGSLGFGSTRSSPRRCRS